MKKYINTSNYYLSSISQPIDGAAEFGTIEVVDIMTDGVSLPTDGYFWIDVDFNDPDKREIFRISARNGYILNFDKRISPNGKYAHAKGAPVGLRDFSELLNSLSKNTDNFGEIEIYSGLQVKIFGGNIYNSGRGYRHKDDTIISIPSNGTYYVEYDWNADTYRTPQEYNKDSYLLAKIVTGNDMVYSVTDMRSVMVSGGGIGDMLKAIYDPNNIEADVFNMDNMVQGNNNQYLSPEDRSDWDSKQEALSSGNNIKTINGQTILGSGNIDITATASYTFETTNNGVEDYILQTVPSSDTGFIVFTNSGTFLVKGTDYTYNVAAHKILFTPRLASNEHAIIWIASPVLSPVNVGDGVTTFTLNGSTIGTTSANQTNNKTINIGTVGDGTLTIVKGDDDVAEFSANQTTDVDIDLDDYIKDGQLLIKQGNVEFDAFSANQTGNTSVQLKDMILVTQAEYDELGPEKTTDGNFYLLYS